MVKFEEIKDPRKQKGLETRKIVEKGIYHFFENEGFRHVRTPLLVVSPGMEVHIRPIQIQNQKTYLPTSPEFSMKKLLASGMDKIFQITNLKL